MKIYPFQGGNNRTARLLEKWFLIKELGKDVINIPSKIYYHKNLNDYYINIKKLGLEYNKLKYKKCLQSCFPHWDTLKIFANNSIPFQSSVPLITAEITKKKYFI